VLQIIEFNDKNDTAMIDTADVTNTNILRPEYFKWRRVSLSQNRELVSLDMEGNSYHDTAKNISRYGSIKLSVKYFATLKRKYRVSVVHYVVVQMHARKNNPARIKLD
jgi:hypothetical protein